MAKLSGPARTFRCVDHTGEDDKGQPVTPQQAKLLVDRCVLAPETMTLKVGCLLLLNIFQNGLTSPTLDRRTSDVGQGAKALPHATHVLTLRQNVVQGVLVNGSVGKVARFLTCKDAKKIHNIEVALSLRDREENPRTGEVRIAEHLWESPTKWPVVEFPGGRTRLIPPHEFTVENVNGTMQALRLQVPLILAWAISIHKSQGQTLQRVRVNLGRIFEKGQGQ